MILKSSYHFLSLLFFASSTLCLANTKVIYKELQTAAKQDENLYKAVSKGKLKKVKSLIADGAQIDYADSFYKALENKDIDILKLIIAERYKKYGHANLNYSKWRTFKSILYPKEKCIHKYEYDSYGNSLTGNFYPTRYDLRRVRSPENNNKWPLPLNKIASTKQGDKKAFDIACLLIMNGADVNIATDGYTPLMSAASNGNTDLMHLFLSKKARINEKNYAGQTALFYAVKDNQKSAVELLLKNGADQNILVRGKTLLMYAAEINNFEIFELLLKNGVDPKVRRQLYSKPENENVLSWVAGKNTKLLRSLLVDYKVDPKESDTALINAISSGSEEDAKLLIEHGDDVNKVITNAATPLLRAIGCGNSKIVKILMDAGVELFLPYQSDYYMEHAIFIAKSLGYVDIAETIFNHPKFNKIEYLTYVDELKLHQNNSQFTRL